MFGNDDQVIEVAGGGGNSVTLSNFKGFADTGWTLDETADYVKATLNSGINVGNGVTEYDQEFLKVIVYGKIEASDNTVRFSLPGDYLASGNFQAYFRDLESDINLESVLDESGNLETTSVRYYVDNLTDSVNIASDGFSDLPSIAGSDYAEDKFTITTDPGDSREFTNSIFNNDIKIKNEGVGNLQTEWNSYGIMITAVIHIEKYTTDEVVVQTGTFSKFPITKSGGENDNLLIVNYG